MGQIGMMVGRPLFLAILLVTQLERVLGRGRRCVVATIQRMHGVRHVLGL